MPNISQISVKYLARLQMTMVPASASVLTVEYKMNLVAPADGEKLIARGKVVRPGRTLIITQAEVFAVKDGVGPGAAHVSTLALPVYATFDHRAEAVYSSASPVGVV